MELETKLRRWSAKRLEKNLPVEDLERAIVYLAEYRNLIVEVRYLEKVHA